MSDIIKLLPDAIANQIAAGEVVQRPSSVVKELLENAVDAKATFIQLMVKEGGRSLIQVIDNGIGMSETDARMSFERHATSKITHSEDLFKIKTFGFRGEALASIAAVAQVEMKSRRKTDELATYLRVESSEVITQENTQAPEGTSISVKNLFYNVPARRNFLKSNPVELKHIVDEFQRVALAHPEIGFSFYQNDLETYQLPAGKLSQRIIGLFGKAYQEQMAACEEATDEVDIKGYIGKPEYAKKTRGEQFFFVNNRFIRNNYLHHAVMNAFEGLIATDQFPFYVLFIEMDPSHIDINVHPTKTEIKFDDERLVYGIVRAAIKKALSTHNIAPSLDFDQDVNFYALNNPGVKNNFNPGSSNDVLQRHNLNNWEKLYEEDIRRSRFNFDHKEDQDMEKSQENTLTFDSAANHIPINKLDKSLLFTEDKAPYQVHSQYIISQIKSGIIMIDQHNSHERILYEKYLGALEKRFGATQQFLFPQQLELNPADFNLVMELEEEIKSLGFVFNAFGKNTIVINGVPAEIQGGNEKDIFEGLIEQFKKNKAELSIDKKENMARALSKRSAMKYGVKLSVMEMNSLIDQLFACQNPNYSPSGEPTFITFSLEKLSAFFKK